MDFFGLSTTPERIKTLQIIFILNLQILKQYFGMTNYLRNKTTYYIQRAEFWQKKTYFLKIPCWSGANNEKLFRIKCRSTKGQFYYSFSNRSGMHLHYPIF